MIDEIIEVELLYKLKDKKESKLYIYEEYNDMVKLELHIDDDVIMCISENYFCALKELRLILSEKNFLILCKGACKNVYPSPMQMSMGDCRGAYELKIGEQALSKNIVDIFEITNMESIGSVDEQAKFYEDWIQSI